MSRIKRDYREQIGEIEGTVSSYPAVSIICWILSWENSVTKFKMI